MCQRPTPSDRSTSRASLLQVPDRLDDFGRLGDGRTAVIAGHHRVGPGTRIFGSGLARRPGLAGMLTARQAQAQHPEHQPGIGRSDVSWLATSCEGQRKKPKPAILRRQLMRARKPGSASARILSEACLHVQPGRDRSESIVGRCPGRLGFLHIKKCRCVSCYSAHPTGKWLRLVCCKVTPGAAGLGSRGRKVRQPGR